MNTTNRNHQISASTNTRTVSLFALLLPLLLLLLGWQSPLAAATLITDKPDYQPGDIVTITGAGFPANEGVSLRVEHFDGTPDWWHLVDHGPWLATALADGTFTTTWIVCPDDLGETLLLTATNTVSGVWATTTFTDAQPPGSSIDAYLNVPTTSWGGTVNNVNSVYYEAQSLPVRVILDNLVAGTTYTVNLKYDFQDVSTPANHFFDFLTSYNATVASPNPPPGSGSFLTAPIPSDLDASGKQFSGVLTAYGVSAVSFPDGYTLDTGKKLIDVQFTASGSSVTLAFGAHFARGDQWGTGNGAGSIPGGSGKIFAKLSTENSFGNVGINLGPSALAADLSITKTDSPDPVCPNGTLTYTVKVLNNGPDPTSSFTVSDNLPATFVTFTPDPVLGGTLGGSGNNRTVTVGSPLAVGATATITFVVTAPPCPATTLNNTATISAASPDDPNLLNNSSGTISTLVQDTTAPVIGSLPGPSTVQCPSLVFTTPTVSDACDPSPTLTFADTSTQGTCAQNKVWTRTWTATDACGNSSTKGQQITVVDTTAPVIGSLPGPSTVQCPTSPSFTTPTVTDACDPTPTLTFADVTTSGTAAESHLVTRTWTALDHCGNSSTKAQQITVVDTTAPLIGSLPDPSTIQCPNPLVFATPTVTDACDPTPTLTFADATTPGTCPQQYSVTRTWTATDASGNSNTKGQEITVIDTTLPVIGSLPAPSTVQCPGTPTFATPTVSDACDPNPTLTSADVTTAGGCPQNSVVTRTWTALDHCGNSSTRAQEVTIVDTTAPVIGSLPEASTVQCPGTPTFSTPTVSDACDPNPTLTSADVTTAGGCPQNSVVTRTWTALDHCGNSSTRAQQVTIVDTTAPVIGLLPEASTVQCPGTPTFSTPTVSDACDPNPTLTSADVTTAGSCPQNSVVTRTWTALDHCGNSSTKAQQVTIVDTTAPVIGLLPEASTVQCPGTPTFSTPTVSDACDPNPTLTSADVTTTGGCPQNSVVTRTWTALDHCGNSSTKAQQVTIVDTTAPVIGALPEASTVQCPGTPTFATPTVSDACDPNPTLTSADVTTAGSCPQNSVVTRTWTALDHCGNSSTKAQQVTIVDTTAPVIGLLPEASTVQCPGTPTFSTPTVSDACDPNPTLTSADVTTAGSCPQNSVVTRTWTALDHCGNSSTKAQQVTIVDTTAPVIGALPEASTVQCPGTPTFSTPTVSDACDPNPTLTSADVTTAGSCPQNHVVTRTWTALDHCGNSSTKAQQVTIVDTTAPVIGALPEASTVQCPGTPTFSTPTVSDACDPNPTLTSADVTTAGGCPQNHVVTRTWTALDHCGNSSTKAQQVTIVDTTAPVIGALPEASTVQCPGTPTFSTPTVSDACDPNPTLTSADVTTAGSCPQNHVVTRTWTALDHCGNSSTKAQQVTIVDTTAPVIGALPEASTVQCPGTPTFSTPTVSDACDPNPTLTSADVTTAGSCPQNSVVTRTWTALDHCGNSSTKAQQVTIVDTTAPVIGSLPEASTVQCPGTPTFSTPTVSDACDPNPTLTSADVTTAGGCPQNSVVTRTWTALDHCGNSSTRAQQVTIVDTTAPVIGLLPAPSTVQCPGTPTFATPTVSDACDPNPTLTSADVTTAGGCPQNSVVTRTWTALDHCGNSSTRAQQVTIVDTTAPVIGLLPAPSTVQCPGTPTFATPTVSDACDPNPTLTSADVTTAGGCPQNSVVTRTWTALDHCGNSSTRAQQVTIVDTTAPVIGLLPAPSTVQCPGTPTFATPTVSDACDPNPTLTSADVTTAGGCPQNSVVTRTWTALDHCGNSSTRAQEVTIVDTTAPVIGLLPAPSTVQCPGTPTFATPTVSDACDPNPTLTSADVTTAGGCPQNSVVTRTWTALDHCGNSSTRAQQVTIVDTTAPVIGLLPAPSTVQCPGTPTFATPTVSDACDPNPTLTSADVTTAGGCPQNSVVTRTWTALDHCGNSSTRAQEVTIVDTTAPVIGLLPAPSTVQCPGTPTFATPTVSDACDPNPTLTSADVTTAGGCPQNSVVTRTWTALDHCGNSSTRAQQVTIVDTTAPMIGLLPAPSTVQCPGTPTFATPTVSDACDPNPTLTSADVTTAGSCAQNKVWKRTWTATDHCGNSSTKCQQISVVDTTHPVIGSVPDYYANCGSGKCSTDPKVTGTPTVSDNCDANVSLTYTDSATPDPTSCEWTITRTWTARDACGNSATKGQQITCAPYGQAIVTDSSLCSYDLDPSTPCRDFRLLFTPYGSGYKLTASNPGQTYYNVFYVGTAGTTVTLDLVLPYPYVTQGANPIHAYDGVAFSGTYPNVCLAPGNPVAISSLTPLPITLANYSPQAAGSFTTITVTMTVPGTGFIYLNVHLDFGLKSTCCYSKGGAGNDAVSQATAQVVVADGTSYLFGVGNDPKYTDGICNMNVFKKNPGVGGRCGKRYAVDGVSDIIATANATATLKDSKGAVLATGQTDNDGWYMLPYKWTGKAATLYVTLQPVGKPAQTQSITLKANGFVELNFDVP